MPTNFERAKQVLDRRRETAEREAEQKTEELELLSPELRALNRVCGTKTSPTRSGAVRSSSPSAPPKRRWKSTTPAPSATTQASLATTTATASNVS